jgi:general L-amino acid transport system substrate-binding protein
VGRKAKQQPADQEWVIFPATPISKEPLGPTYGQNDSAWADAVNWTVYSMIIMDEYGVTSANIDATCATAEAEVARLCGGDGELQTAMGLSADAFHQVIKQVGSYGEVYDRNLNPVGLYREGSANAGWLDGGLIYSPPAR